MTELTITPKVSDKTARFKGTIAAGEHVAVTIKGGAEWIADGANENLTLRVIDLVTKRTLAVFPRPPEVMDEGAEPDAWADSGEDLTCTLNLNTLRMVNAARHMLRVPVMFVLGDTDAPRTLYFRDQYEVEYWPERIGDDEPYDLDKWPKKIDDWTALVAEWTAQMATFGATLSGHVENDGIHVGENDRESWNAKLDESDILSGGKIKTDLLPSYVDDVLEYAAVANFPATGEEGKIYVAKDENKTYRWSGTQYVEVGGGANITVDSALSTTSTNPVQNKVVTEALGEKLSKTEAKNGFTEWGWTSTGPTVTEIVWRDGRWVAVFSGGLYEFDSPSASDFHATELHSNDVNATRTRLPTMADIPTKTSDLTNDSGFLTQHQSLAGLMPMYPFSAPTFTQTANSFSFSGTDAASGYHYEIEYSSGTWSLYKVADGSTHSSGDTPTDTNTTAAENATEVVFSTAGVTATRVYVCTLSPFTNAQIEMGKWTITPTPPISAGTGEPLYVAWDEEDGWQFTDGADPSSFGNTDPDAVSLSVDYCGVTYTATRPPSAFEIAVGALPTGVTGKARDCILVIDCTGENAVAPTVAWDTHFHPRTDKATDLAIVETGKRAVFYISEYASGEFAVGGWQETEGGYPPDGGSE